jgi:hypothetical protein
MYLHQHFQLLAPQSKPVSSPRNSNPIFAMSSHTTVVVQEAYPVGSAYSYSSPGSTPRSSPSPAGYDTTIRHAYGGKSRPMSTTSPFKTLSDHSKDHLSRATSSGNGVVVMDHGTRLMNGDPSPSYSRSPQHGR